MLGYWIDPSTGLMWATKDNGRDVTWSNATKYCRNLRLAGYSDWKLANMVELQGIYDQKAESPGLGKNEVEAFMWHVKGNIFLTALEWSSNYSTDDRGRPSGYAYYFDFNSGKPDKEETGAGFHALCVRRAER